MEYKYYDNEFIRKYIEENKEEIKSVSVGMLEDWFWTAATIYENNDYIEEYKEDIKNKKTLLAMGISGSYWATPIMEVEKNDGNTEKIECYFIDDEKIAKQTHENLLESIKNIYTGV